ATSDRAMPARNSERVVANGFQKPQGVECRGRSALGDRRLQPLCAGAAGGVEQPRRAGAGATGVRFYRLWRAPSDVDGPRHSLVEPEVAQRNYAPDGVADEARHSPALERLSPSADAGQGGTLSRHAGTGAATARGAAPAAAGLAGRVSL